MIDSDVSTPHERVQKWTKNVDLFEKDFIVIPINEHAHWYMAIVCFPGRMLERPQTKAASVYINLEEPDDKIGGTELHRQIEENTWVMVFDSLGHQRITAMRNLKECVRY